MLNAEQDRYIKNLIDTNPGLAEDFLRSTLEGAGWPETDVTEAFSIYYAVKSTPKNTSPHTLSIVLARSIVGVIVIILSVLILRYSTQESLVKDMTSVDAEILVQFETNLNEIQQLYSETLNAPEMLSILQETNFLDFYPDVLGRQRIEIVEIDIRRAEVNLESILTLEDEYIRGNRLEMQKKFEIDLKEAKETLVIEKANIEDWKQEKRKELEADLILRKEKLEQRNPIIEQALVMLRNQEPTLATEVDAVEQGKQIQDTSSKFKYLLLKKLSKIVADAGEPGYDYTELILQYDPNTLNEESYYVFQAILTIVDERYGRVALEQDLLYI